VTCTGNTGHGSRFIADNAAEKMVGFIVGVYQRTNVIDVTCIDMFYALVNINV
jgi:hypothetical protein